MDLFIDLETYCEVPIGNGTHAYAEQAEVLLTSWAIDKDPVYVCEGLSASLQAMINAADNVVFHSKDDFDRIVLMHQDITIPHEKIWNTSVQALSHGLPAGLDRLCTIMGVPDDMAKQKIGKQMIQLFCKPPPKNVNRGRATKFTHPTQWAQFVEYAGMDIVAMRELKRRMPNVNYPANQRERDLFCLDLRMNDRGILTDLDLAHAAIETVSKTKKIMDARTQEITEDELRSTTQRDQLLKLVLKDYGVTLPDMQASTLETRLNNPDLPAGARELLAIRLQTSTTSNAKYNRLLKAVSSDGRLRGAIQFSGAARTKRWSGRIFQPQNLPRPDMDADDIDLGIECIKSGSSHLIYDEPIKLASNALRGVIIAPEGRKLVVSDLAQVEARVLPWLAGEQWKLDAFREYDAGRARDNYVMAYARGFNVEPEDVDKHGRQIGKVSELSCLGPRTQVLTSNGAKPITEVTLQDQLWDGKQWVAHQGLVSRGVKQVINLRNLVVTPDHQIFVGNHWVEAQMVASNRNTLQLALETASESLPRWASFTEPKAAYTKSSSNAPAAQRHTTSSATISAKGPALAAIRALRKQLGITSKSTTAMPMSVLTTATAVDYLVGSRPASIDAATPMTLRTATMEAEAYQTIGAKIAEPSWHIWSLLKGGISLSWRWIEKMSTAITSRGISASLLKNATTKIAELFSRSNSVSPSWSDVYDIAHAGPLNRFTILTEAGPMIVHNCGYGGSKAAWKAMGALYGFDLPDRQVMDIVNAWRAAHPAICDWETGFWKQLDDAARQAIASPNKTFKAGEFIRFERHKEWLRMLLPSGSYLNYAAPAIIEDPRRAGSMTVSYMGINNYTKKWERMTTYGGKLSADATQSTAREIMAENLPWIEQQGYLPILLVHDEVVTETPDTEDYSVGGLNTLMSYVPDWATGLPLAAGGFEAYRYRKD